MNACAYSVGRRQTILRKADQPITGQQSNGDFLSDAIRIAVEALFAAIKKHFSVKGRSDEKRISAHFSWLRKYLLRPFSLSPSFRRTQNIAGEILYFPALFARDFIVCHDCWALRSTKLSTCSTHKKKQLAHVNPVLCDKFDVKIPSWHSHSTRVRNSTVCNKSWKSLLKLSS